MMEHFPQLHTSRLHLRKLEPEDIPSLVNHANNPKIARHVINIPHPYQEMDAVMRLSYVVQGFKKKVRYVFAIIQKERGELIGEISLHLENDPTLAELGYWVGEPFWNQGIATEAIAAVTTFGFEKLGLRLIYVTCHAENPASAKVLEKNGMRPHHETGNVIQFRLAKKADDLEGG